MSSTLEPWLAAIIEGELGEALSHWANGTIRHQSSGKSRGLSYDDGSNLRIPSAKKGPVVQITEFLTFKDPIQVTLSDSVTRVNASITNQSSQRYADLHKKNITEGTAGGLIQLLEFEIVATHLGPRNKRLTLYVKEFKTLGSNSSGNFGVAQHAIESREGTKALLNKLENLRRHGSDAHSEQSAAASPIRSQPSTQTSEEGNDQESQFGFATQVPRSIASNNKTKTSLNVSSPSTSDSAKSLDITGKIKNGIPLLNTLDSSQAQAAPQTPRVMSKEILLGLIRNQRRARLAPEISDSIARERENEASNIIALVPGDENASGAPIGLRKRKRHSPDIAPRKKTADNHDSHGIDKDHESLKANSDLENRARPEVALAEASVDTLRSQPASPSLSEIAKYPSYAPLQSSMHSTSKVSSSTSAQKSARNRISSRDVNIPKDQEVLLNGEDSWLPAEPGQREPTANIPISLLRTLNRKADLRAQRPTKMLKKINGAEVPNAVIDTTTDSETDNPISSGQWPASPERDQLPPDSSLGSAQDSDHSIQSMPNSFRSVSSIQKQSHESISSQSTPSRRSSPISKSPSDEEIVRSSSTKSVLEKNLPPRAFHHVVQPATDPDDAYVAKEAFSSLPASPTPEPDLEMTIPLALNEKTDIIASSAPVQPFPSTASQSQDPFTQVKRTPYVNGRIQNELLPGSSPLNLRHYPLANGNLNDETEYVSASVPSGPKTTAETRGENGSSHSVGDRSIGKVVDEFAEGSNSQEAADSNTEKPHELVIKVQLKKSKEGLAAVKPDNLSLVKKQSQCQSSSVKQPALITEANIKYPAVSKKKLTTECNQINHPPQLHASEHAAQFAHETKRKFADSSFISSSVAKRQKRFKVPSAFTLTERSEVPRDPSEGARQYRQDFLASRRSSESRTPTMSPTMPLTFFQGTKLERPRDPSEGALQILQENLASRRSSETSTPSTSPRIYYTALTGTVQAVYPDTEVEKEVEQVTVQNQYFNTEIQLQKMTELEELSARSQTGSLKLDAAHLPSGTADIESDRDDTKPGAQENPPFNCKADSPLFVTQDAQKAYFERPKADINTMVEASSHASIDEKQRAQPVKLDLSVRSPDRPETEDGFANATVKADQNVDSGIDTEVGNHNQYTNKIGEGHRVLLERDRAHQNLLSRADEVVEQGSNVLRLNLVLGHPAATDSTAFKSAHQQKSMEVNQGPQMHNKHVSELTPQLTSIPSDVDTTVPDRIAIEPKPHQEMNEKDSNTPTPDVQTFQDVTLLKSTSYAGERMNQTTRLSSIVPTFVAVSNMENQPHLSSSDLNLAKSPSSPRSDSKAKSIEKQQNSMQLPVEITKKKPLSLPQSIFDKFKANYPIYPGDEKHFAAICGKISRLVKGGRMEHQSLWDDFIVRHKVEYPHYLRRCAEEAEDAMPYEMFYQNEIEGPQYQKRVINRCNLDEVLALVVEQPGFEQIHPEPIKNDERRVELVDHASNSESGLIVEKMDYGDAPAKDNEPVEPVEIKSVPISTVSDKNARKPSEPRTLIDLTENDRLDDLPKSTKDRASTNSTTKSFRRPLPWISSDYRVLRSSPNATVSDSSRILPSSGLVEIRARGSSNAGDARLQVSANSTSRVPRQTRGLLNTCHRVIHSEWGIKAHELLEPEYSPGQGWSETMIELLAEIASKINSDEARNRIKGAIDTRIRENARRDAGHPNRQRKILKSDLEAVKGVVESSSTTTTSPFSPPRTNAVVEKQKEGTPSEWWDDNNSPFKSFVRAYASIRHGNGNSFAKNGPMKPEDTTSTGIQLRKIDIMKWIL